MSNLVSGVSYLVSGVSNLVPEEQFSFRGELFSFRGEQFSRGERPLQDSPLFLINIVDHFLWKHEGNIPEKSDKPPRSSFDWEVIGY